MQAQPITLRLRSGELQVLSTPASARPASPIGMVASTIHTASRKCRSSKSRRTSAPSELDGELPHVAPEIAHDRGQCGELHGGGECRARILPSQQRRHDPHMRGRGDRQQLGDALHHAQHRHLGITQRHEPGVDRPACRPRPYCEPSSLCAAFTYEADALSRLLQQPARRRVRHPAGMHQAGFIQPSHKCRAAVRRRRQLPPDSKGGPGHRLDAAREPPADAVVPFRPRAWRRLACVSPVFIIRRRDGGERSLDHAA